MPGVELGDEEKLAPVQVLDGCTNQAFSLPFPVHFSGVDHVDSGRQAVPYGRDFLLPPAGIFPHVPGAQAQLAQFFPFDGHVFHALASIYFLFSCFSVLLYSFYFFFPLSIVHREQFLEKSTWILPRFIGLYLDKKSPRN